MTGKGTLKALAQRKLKMRKRQEPSLIAVVIPCYRVSAQILKVIDGIGPEVSAIYAVDDFCPENTGKMIAAKSNDPRVRIINHVGNQGVGGAVVTGYFAALADGMDVIVKIDGDGQMDPSLISTFIAPILSGEADYTKGNRFFSLEQLYGMPRIRLFGNAALSLLTKLSSGYWNVFDPTNGFTAISSNVAKSLPLDKISRRYFFETDMLFRLGTLRAVVVDIPMDARYANEKSGLKIGKVIPEFLLKHIQNTLKRIFYNYYLRDMSVASIELPLGIILFLFGCYYGIDTWILSAASGTFASAGKVMLSALPVIAGIQLLLSVLAYDVANVPNKPIHRKLNIPQQKSFKT